MSKRTIIERANGKPERATEAPGAAKSGQGGLDEYWTSKIASAVAERVCERLERFLPICARLAAADTLHTSETEAKVLRRAIGEGIRAAAMIREEVRDGRAAE